MAATRRSDQHAATTGARIAVCVSGEGTNLRALRARERSGEHGWSIALVVADRPCPALAYAADENLPTAVVDPTIHDDRSAWDAALADTLHSAGADAVVLAGFMRVLGPATLAAFGGRILNVHPSLLPAFPGAHAIRDALAAGVRVTGVTVHLVDENLDGGPIVAQEPVAVLPGDDEQALLARLHAAEHQLLPHVLDLLVAGAFSVAGGRVDFDRPRAAAALRRRRALLSVSDKTGLAAFGTRLAGLGFELVSTGGTARTLRETGLAVTDVADVTGFPEMLDGRVKTLHPRVSAGVLADLRSADHREQLAAAAIEPFELVVVNLYPFAEAAARSDATLDELIEQIDIGGPTLVRAAAKNHASVGIVTDPAQYDAVIAELGHGGGLTEGMRRELALAAFKLTAAYDTMIAGELAGRWYSPLPAASPVEAPEPPATVRLELRRLHQLRYGENPHQSAGLYAASGMDLAPGAFSDGAALLQGKPLSYNNILDAAAATALARDLRGAACAVIKHANPCGAAEADDLLTAWELALAGDPVSAFGGVVALTRPLDATLAERLTQMFLEVVAAPACSPEALAILARKPNLRVLLDPGLGAPPGAGYELRSAGGALLVSQADTARDDPATWQCVSSRAPTPRELDSLELAWRICRHVKSNAVVLVRERALVGVGAGQASRVDSARLAVAKAGGERVQGAVCASDAFYPFPDAVEVCLEAGVSAFVQPGGSVRDAQVVTAVDAAEAAMITTGVRHFRH